MTTNNCLYYDPVLQKPIPCFIVPNQVYTIENRKYVNITWDTTQFDAYNTSLNELNRYSSDTIRLLDLYPNTTSAQLTYATACFPNLIANPSTYENDELVRCQALVNMVLNVTSPDTVSKDTFFKVADFLSYEVLFLVLQHVEREFMLTIANVPLTTDNVAAVIAEFGGITTLIPFLQSVLTLFNSYNTSTVIYYLQNIMNLSNVVISEGITFPMALNIPLLYSNLQFLQTNGYIS